MTNKKMAILVLVVFLAPIWVPVALVATAISTVLFFGAFKGAPGVKWSTGGEVYSLTGWRESAMEWSLRIGGMGFMDMSMSPAIALPKKGWVLLFGRKMSGLSQMLQDFILQHELAHLRDPEAAKPMAGVKIKNEYTADDGAFIVLGYEACLIDAVFDELFYSVTHGLSDKKSKTIQKVIELRRAEAQRRLRVREEAAVALEKAEEEEEKAWFATLAFMKECEEELTAM